MCMCSILCNCMYSLGVTSHHILMYNVVVNTEVYDS